MAEAIPTWKRNSACTLNWKPNTTRAALTSKPASLEVFAESIARPRLLALLLATFAVLSLLLAVVGTYGVLAYMVTVRRREIAIRMALGAGSVRVLRDVILEGLRLTLLGVLSGTAIAIFLNRLMAALLFGVGPSDPATFTIAIPAIVLLAALACSLPAWRATGTDPNAVLRSE